MELNIKINAAEPGGLPSVQIDCGALIGSITTGSRQAAEQGIRLEWSQTLCDGKRVNFDKAEKACAALGPGWRLPEVSEQHSCVDYTRCDPAVDPALHPDIKSGPYWTRTEYKPDPSCAWIVLFNYGGVGAYHRDGYNAFVRACRVVPAGQ